MKYFNMINAIPALKEIMQLRLPYAKARDIYKIYKQLEEEYGFFSQEEMKLVREFADKDENGNPKMTQQGAIQFKDAASKAQYINKFNELGAQEIKLTPVVITENEIGDQAISPDTINKLDGIISFT